MTKASDIRLDSPASPQIDIPPPAAPTQPDIRQRLDKKDFPHPPQGQAQSLTLTIENLEHLFSESGIRVHWDVIKKEHRFTRNGKPCSEMEVISRVNLYGLAGSWLNDFIHDIAKRNPVNPVRDWIKSTPWDGRDRFPDLLNAFTFTPDYPAQLGKILLMRWMLSAAAAAIVEGKPFAARGVLTLQGGQGIGKTSMIASLLPSGTLREMFFKRDHHMDGSSKDSILSAIRHWIVEIGELDSSFKKDVARLKGFLTNDCDKVRPPYGRREVEFDRRTVFAATVNETNFLVDPTGNSRFWTLPVTALNYNHDIDMQQLFAQLAIAVDQGEQWWLTSDEESLLEDYNRRHQAVSVIKERILEIIDHDAIGSDSGTYLTALEVLQTVGMNHPTNAQCRECGSVLRELFGQPKRVQGRDKWRIPEKSNGQGKMIIPPDAKFD
jgi:predicted P-loop ATPase